MEVHWKIFPRKITYLNGYFNLLKFLQGVLCQTFKIKLLVKLMFVQAKKLKNSSRFTHDGCTVLPDHGWGRGSWTMSHLALTPLRSTRYGKTPKEGWPIPTERLDMVEHTSEGPVRKDDLRPRKNHRWKDQWGRILVRSGLIWSASLE